MRTIRSLKKHHYLKRVSISLIIIALVAGMAVAGIVGCGSLDCNLMINSTSGGSVTIPGEGTFTYTCGTVVNLMAQVDACYEFVNWTGDVGTISDVNAAATTITVNGHYSITANFEATPLDHFKCYTLKDAPPLEEDVYLEDQFGAVNATVERANLFCNPAEKSHAGVTTPILNSDHHLTVYSLSHEGEPQEWFVEVDNQFGAQNLTVSGPVALAVPTQKAGHLSPLCLDHFLLYEVIEGPPVNVVVDLNDQFGSNQDVLVYEPFFFANPARKTHGGNVTEIEIPEAHLVFYRIEGGVFETGVQVVNQFGEQTLNIEGIGLLAVPSEKIDWHELAPLDHFECYFAQGGESIMEFLYLEDQFGAVEVLVTGPTLFCNPVEKWHDEVLTPISNPDHHLTVYCIHREGDPQWWQVEVHNQFGTQQLTVAGPVYLVVPTQKVAPGGHEPPVGLDHYLIYDVIEGPSMEVVVDLNDQFGSNQDVLVYEPFFFANPVRKTHGGNVTEIENPEAHLVFYLGGGSLVSREVRVVDQFGEQTFTVNDEITLLAVPSEKLSAEPVD